MFLSVFANAHAKSIVTDDFLYKVANIESNGNPNAVGDSKKALGMFQMHECAFKDASAYIRMTNEHPFIFDFKPEWKNFKTAMKDESAQAIFAKAYLKFIEHALQKRGVKVTEMKIYMCYNMGVYGATGHDFDPFNKHLPPSKKAIFLRASKYLNQ